MQFLKSWATEDRKTLLHFSESSLKIFSSFAQTKGHDLEAGGILLGSVHGDHMLIEQATVPTEHDKRSRHLFERLPFGHETIAKTSWSQSNGIIRYLGEWHTHPEDIPTPSGLDRSEWNLLSSKRLDRRCMLAVIVGRKGLYVEAVPNSGFGPILSPLE